MNRTRPVRTETILVVEDEIDVRFFLETMLKEPRLSVVCAADSVEASPRSRCIKDKIRLVFSDIGLPRVDGI